MTDATSHHLHAFGLNHETAPVDVREKIAFPQDRLIPALTELTRDTPVEEAVILSTCNRTEIYCKTPSPDDVAQWLARHHALEGLDIAQYLYRRDGSAAAHHAFRVASGLDSMVLGEPQILGQVKQAVRSAEEAGTLGPMLHKLFQQTFSVAKAVRSQTAIGERSVSLAAAALKVATSVLGSMEEQSILFIGAGEMVELVATHFLARRPRAVTVANRTLERGRELARQLGGEAITLSELPSELQRHDIIISSTASHLPLIGKGMVERAVKARKHRPMVMIDLAVPRDIEAEVAQLDDVFLYSVDDLGDIVQENRDSRQSAVVEAEAIISTRVGEFVDWIHTRDVVPTIRLLRDHAERYRQLELERARRALARGDDPQQVLEMLSSGLLNKLLHHPVQTLHQSRGEHRQQLAEALHRLFIREKD
ncbi:MAG: glutamyl-tRNA reductase [Betaproteobacteria bacterium]|nr:glutamyl-tRNA reductase [Betaproteobacteria bacterium]